MLHLRLSCYERNVAWILFMAGNESVSTAVKAGVNLTRVPRSSFPAITSLAVSSLSERSPSRVCLCAYRCIFHLFCGAQFGLHT